MKKIILLNVLIIMGAIIISCRPCDGCGKYIDNATPTPTAMQRSVETKVHHEKNKSSAAPLAIMTLPPVSDYPRACYVLPGGTVKCTGTGIYLSTPPYPKSNATPTPFK